MSAEFQLFDAWMQLVNPTSTNNFKYRNYIRLRSEPTNIWKDGG